MPLKHTEVHICSLFSRSILFMHSPAPMKVAPRSWHAKLCVVLSFLGCVSIMIFMLLPSNKRGMIGPIQIQLKRPELMRCAGWSPRDINEQEVSANADERLYINRTSFARQRAILACNESPRWSSLVFKLHNKKRVDVLVVGGSETAGIECDDKFLRGSARECAWPARLKLHLLRIFPETRVQVRNIASGGTTITAGLAALGAWLRSESPPDVLLVDYIVNDAFEVQVGQDGQNWPLLTAAYERFIHAARSISPSTEIVFVNTCTLEICQDVDRMINAVAARYSVPVVSMHALTFLERILTNNVASGSTFWDVDGTHPPFYVHKLIADIVASCLQHRRDPDCNSLRPDTIVSRRHYDSVSVCERPLSSFTAGARLHLADAVDVVSNGWRLFEDRPGKPGWISESPNATISFPLRFGPSPRIVISYLKSYNGMSNARIWIDDRQGEPAIVRGRYDGTDARVSQTAVHIIHAGMTTYIPRLGLDGVIGWGLEPHSQHVLHFAVDTINEDLTRPINGAFKFKILSVYSC
jgi:lysophospholipase L1-like esterase